MRQLTALWRISKLYFMMLFSVAFILETYSQSDPDSPADTLKYNILIPTFLGNQQRNYYGDTAPDRLEMIWKLYLGKGETVISRKLGSRIWEGAGWTGQPLLVQEDKNLFIIQGSYDHHLKKIDASNGNVIWQYQFDDVVKGTGTIWNNQQTDEIRNKVVILQGSRLGVGNYLDTKHIPSYRAISYITGEELWRLDVKWTDSYSRDADGSALILNDTAYLGLENSLFTVFCPDYRMAEFKDGMLQPSIYQELPLYESTDVIAHKNNVVTESSPSLLDGVIYVASGSGHVIGYDLLLKEIVWDFYIGSDIDGSAIVTSDSCLLVSIEKQYISGPGGVFKLNPKKQPDNAVVWYFPVENREYASWQGGIIGSVGINDFYNDGAMPYIAAFSAIDGYLYVVNHKELAPGPMVLGPDSTTLYSTPSLLYKMKIGPSISTPIIVHDKIIAASYQALYLLQFNQNLEFRLLDKFVTTFEATPVVFDRKVYIASRDGYFYCLGNVR